MRIRTLLSLFVLAGSTLAAHASDLTYDVTGGTLLNTADSQTGSFFGSFDINGTTNIIDSGVFTVTAPSGGTVYNFAAFSATSGIPGLALFSDGAGDSFELALHLPPYLLNTLTSTPGGPGADTEITLASGAKFDATGGTVSAVTPEPSSLLLLGSGVLGLAGAVRRKLVR